jgi:exopolysaccharide production protein ExoQ
MSHIILITCLALSFWLVRRDRAARPGVSSAIWIPTLWVGIIASRPVSLWLGAAGNDTIEGSPIDRMFFFVLIVASLVVLSRRALAWGPFLARNWPLVLFYGFLLVSVLWANSPLSSFKRWTKEAGNILVILVVLTEKDPLQAIRAVFVRCSYVLIPLSFVLVRYFPHLGRRYSLHTGELEITGATMQKNALGAMIVVFGLVCVWDWLERSRPGAERRSLIERFAFYVLFAAGLLLLYRSDSKTSLVAFTVAAAIVAAVRLPLLRRNIRGIGLYCMLGAAGFMLLDWVFGISTALVSNLGRDMTFTGRTDVWRELLNLKTDPIFGTGFMSLWDDAGYRARLPEWVAFSAHNGYLEVYLAAGWIGIGLLTLMLFTTGLRINQALATAEPYAVVRFAILVATLIANFAESNFATMSPIGFLFLIAVIGQARFARVSEASAPDLAYPSPYGRPAAF